MLEMATSAGRLLLPTTGSAHDAPLHALLLLGVSIPSPLALPPSSAAIFSANIDAYSGQCRVQSQMGAKFTYLSASYASVSLKASAVPGKEAARGMTTEIWKIISTADNGNPTPVPMAVSDVVQSSAGQSTEYTIHPAVVDYCTQVTRKSDWEC